MCFHFCSGMRARYANASFAINREHMYGQPKGSQPMGRLSFHLAAAHAACSIPSWENVSRFAMAYGRFKQKSSDGIWTLCFFHQGMGLSQVRLRFLGLEWMGFPIDVDWVSSVHNGTAALEKRANISGKMWVISPLSHGTMWFFHNYENMMCYYNRPINQPSGQLTGQSTDQPTNRRTN